MLFCEFLTLSETFLFCYMFYYHDEEKSIFIRLRWVTCDEDGLYINQQIRDDNHFITWDNVKTIEIDHK